MGSGGAAPHPAAGATFEIASKTGRASPGPRQGDQPSATADSSPVRRVSRFDAGDQQLEPTKGGAAIAVDDARINEQIRAREVRLVGDDGTQLGVTPLPEALEYARSKDLDLVEVAPNASPPVCRVMDFGKYKYEQDQRRKEARKKQRQSHGQISIKEMKFRPKIDAHDYATKVRHVERFLREGSKVKLTIMFRGREVSHPELGKRILDRVAEEVGEIAEIEHYPRIDGRNMTMVLAPVREGRRRKPVPVSELGGEVAPAIDGAVGTAEVPPEQDAGEETGEAGIAEADGGEAETQPGVDQEPAALAEEKAL